MNHQHQSTPPTLDEICRKIAARRAEVARLGARRIDVFGSCARGTQSAGSDIDILVTLEPDRDYFDLGEIKHILEVDFEVDLNPILASGVAEDNPIRRECVRVF